MIDTFLAWLSSTTLRASLLALAIICIQAALHRWLPPRWRYALWLPMILVLIAPILPTSKLSLQNHLTPKTVILEHTPANFHLSPSHSNNAVPKIPFVS